MMSCNDEGSDDSTLDFLSPSFDPVKALQVTPTKIHLPHPTVQACDNLQAYTSVVQGTRQIPRQPHPPLVRGNISQEERGVASGRNTGRNTGRKGVKTVVDFMEKPRSGPFSLLQQCHRDGRRVKVMIRHCAGVRGVCEGDLLAFDRHMNIALGNVTEWCTPIKTVSNGGITQSKSTRRRNRKGIPQSLEAGDAEHKVRSNLPSTAPTINPKAKHILSATGTTCEWEVSRISKQLFIRGDNIVLITPVSCE